MSLASVNGCRNKDGCWCVSSMSTTFACLSADKVYTGGDGFWYVIRMANHLNCRKKLRLAQLFVRVTYVHDWDPGFV